MNSRRVDTRVAALSIASVALLGFVGCPSGVKPRAADRSASRPPGVPSSRDDLMACGAAIPGEDRLEAPIVLVGELHGTTEIPAAFGHLVCHAAALRRTGPVLVGLEIPSSAQALLDAFLDSDGGAGATAALLAHEFWHRESQDGRSSRAMLDLLQQLRRYRTAGDTLAVRAIDPMTSEMSGNDRDAGMAASIIRAIEEIRPSQTLALVGDVHTRIIEGYPWDPSAAFVSLGTHLRARFPDLIGLGLRFSGGTAWTCTGDTNHCGAGPLRTRDIGSPTPRIALDLASIPTSGYSGMLFIGEVSASSPAYP